MDIDIITQYILAIVPAVTAIMGMIVCVGVGIGKIKKANRDTAEQVGNLSRDNRELKKQMSAILEENVLLKRSLNELNRKLENIKVIKER